MLDPMRKRAFLLSLCLALGFGFGTARAGRDVLKVLTELVREGAVGGR